MQHLESLFGRALDAVVGMDHLGNVIAWNVAAEDMFGWTRDEAFGQSMGELIVPPQHRSAHATGLDHYNRTGHGPVLEQRVRLTAMHRSGTEFPVELSIFPMKDSDENSSFYAFIRSLANEEAHRREQELRAREAEVLLEVAQKLLEDISLEEFTEFCLEQVCAVAGLDAAHVFILRGTGSNQILVPSSIWHVRDERYRKVIDASEELTFELGHGLPGRAWKARDLVAIDDLAADPDFIRKTPFTQAGLTRGAALPVLQGDRLYAVIEFYGAVGARFDAEMLRMLKTIGSQIGAAVRRKEAAEQRETQRREVAHRVGNSLTILSSIYRSCARQASSIDELSHTFLNRLLAVGRANHMSLEDSNHGVDLGSLIKDAVGLLPDGDRIAIAAPELIVEAGCVMPLSLVLNELATNTLKYGPLGTNGTLSITVSACPKLKELRFDWHEARTEPLEQDPPEPRRIGFGTHLIRSMIEGRLGGSFERHIDRTGFRLIARMPRSVIEANAS